MFLKRQRIQIALQYKLCRDSRPHTVCGLPVCVSRSPSCALVGRYCRQYSRPTGRREARCGAPASPAEFQRLRAALSLRIVHILGIAKHDPPRTVFRNDLLDPCQCLTQLVSETVFSQSILQLPAPSIISSSLTRHADSLRAHKSEPRRSA